MGRDRLLIDAIQADPLQWLGPEHVAVYGSDPAVLVKFIDAGQRLPRATSGCGPGRRDHSRSPTTWWSRSPARLWRTFRPHRLRGRPGQLTWSRSRKGPHRRGSGRSTPRPVSRIRSDPPAPRHVRPGTPPTSAGWRLRTRFRRCHLSRWATRTGFPSRRAASAAHDRSAGRLRLAARW